MSTANLHTSSSQIMMRPVGAGFSIGGGGGAAGRRSRKISRVSEANE